MLKIILTGNVGRDPELRADKNGDIFVTFSIGVSVGNKQNPKTTWIECTCNNKLSDVAKNYVKKGSKLLIVGFPSINAYINKNNEAVGNMRVNVNELEFIGSLQEKSQDINQNIEVPLLKSDEVPF
jgi:single-strand DNA-binding protein